MVGRGRGRGRGRRRRRGGEGGRLCKCFLVFRAVYEGDSGRVYGALYKGLTNNLAFLAGLYVRVVGCRSSIMGAWNALEKCFREGFSCNINVQARSSYTGSGTQTDQSYMRPPANSPHLEFPPN